MSQKETNLKEDQEIYQTVIEFLQNPEEELKEESLAEFTRFLIYFKAQYPEEAEKQKVSIKELQKMIEARRAKRPSSSEPKTKKSSVKVKILKRSSSVDNITEQSKKKKEKKKRELPHYKKNKPRKRNDVVYEGKTFKYKTQLVDGPQLACIYNSTWNKQISCKMYLNLGQGVYRRIIKDNSKIQQYIESGHIIVRNSHSEKEEAYIEELKKKGVDPQKQTKSNKVGPKPLPLEEDDDEESDSDLDGAADYDKRKKRQIPKAIETEDEEDMDEDDDDSEEYDQENQKNAIDEDEDEGDDEYGDNEEEEVKKKKKKKVIKLNPVSSLKKPQKTTRNTVQKKISTHLESATKEEKNKYKNNDKLEKKKKEDQKNKKLEENKKKKGTKKGKKQTKKASKKNTKKQAKKPKMIEEKESDDDDSSNNNSEQEDEEGKKTYDASNEDEDEDI